MIFNVQRSYTITHCCRAVQFSASIVGQQRAEFDGDAYQTVTQNGDAHECVDWNDNKAQPANSSQTQHYHINNIKYNTIRVQTF